MAIKHIRGNEPKIVAVLGETKTGIYFPALHPNTELRSIYVSNTGQAQTSKLTIQALSRMSGHTPIYEGDTINIEFSED